MKYKCGCNQDEVEINFPSGNGLKILVGLSGGADSAILLYILAKMNRDQNLGHQLIPFTIPRPDGGARYSPKIASWVANKLQVQIPEPMIVGDGHLPHAIVVEAVVRKLLRGNEYDFLFIAENKIPPAKIEGLAPRRAPQSSYKRVALPFWGVTKDCSIDLYYQENVPELLELSHSCTELVDDRCHKCFQCNERAWAFSQLGRDDPGHL